jgi:hypothetical protein
MACADRTIPGRNERLPDLKRKTRQKPGLWYFSNQLV